MKKLLRTSHTSGGGFTLIEMLIVIAIIAILAGIVLTGVRGFQATARDTKRIGDTRNIQNLLELHFTRNGGYPATLGNLDDLGRVPTPPPGATPSQIEYGYKVDGSKLSYCLQANLENDNSAAADDAQGGDGNGTCATACNAGDVFCATSG